MFFSKPGAYEAVGLFGWEHLLLFVLTITFVVIAVKKTKISNKEQITKIIRELTVLIWVLEIIKIIFNLLAGNAHNVNTYIPLYYCSLLLYAGLFSGFAKGKLNKMGDIFLAVGSLVAGICFLILPTTSLVSYPLWHFISIHSFFYHGVMIYLGIIVNKYNYVKVECKDIKYYMCLILIVCFFAYLVNSICDSNLMFISKDFAPISFLYNATGSLFTLVMIIIQATIPFYLGLILRKIIIKIA